MSKPTDITYELVLGDTPYELGQEVTRRLRMGWELVGQPFLARNRGVFQAMVFQHDYVTQQRLDQQRSNELLNEVISYANAA